jgi:hypothetical protein
MIGMQEIKLVVLVGVLAMLITPRQDSEQFERTERIETHVEALSIQSSLEKHRVPLGERNVQEVDFVDVNVVGKLPKRQEQQ